MYPIPVSTSNLGEADGDDARTRGAWNEEAKESVLPR
jgi:hypothetical protein